MPRSTHEWFWTSMLVAMPVALHVQLTLPLGGGDARLALSDVMGLLVSPLVIWLIWAHRGTWNRREIWPALALIAAGSVVMTIGLARTGMSSHGISNWAIVRYLGWYALIYYGVLGVLGAQLAPKTAIEWFIRVFVIIHAALTLAFIGLGVVGISWPTIETPRFTGVTGNPNAHALSLVCGLALLIGTGERLFSRLPFLGYEVLCGLICAGVFFTRSLAGLAGLVVIAVAFLVSRSDFLRVLRISLLALAFFGLPWLGHTLSEKAGFAYGQAYDGIGRKLANPDKYAASLSVRMESNRRAFDLWQEAPVLGAGLGVFYQKEKARAEASRAALVVHNTALWLLAEMGLVGLIAFGAIFVGTGWYLLQAGRQYGWGPPHGGLYLSGSLILLAWATMSMAHELMYQRVPWMMLGVALGAALRKATARHPKNHSSSVVVRTLAS